MLKAIMLGNCFRPNLDFRCIWVAYKTDLLFEIIDVWPFSKKLEFVPFIDMYIRDD